MQASLSVEQTPEAPCHGEVFLIGEPSDFSELASKLTNLGYQVVDGGEGVHAEAKSMVLLSAKVDPQLDLARHLAADHRVMVIHGQPDFAFQLAAARYGVEAVSWGPVDLIEMSAWLNQDSATSQQQYAILIIDDDELAAHACAIALETAGMKTEVITDPAETINAISAFKPDLVLLDMHMPGANGLEVARVIRQSRENLSLPIVFLSAEKDETRQDYARRIGGDDFISKPVDLKRLADQVAMRAERAVALRQLAERDSLTGLLNHARFKERVAAELGRAKRSNTPLSVCLIDLDHFKSINDTHGHQVGDKVIQMLSYALTARLRRTDVIARYGGEEFGVMLLDTDPATASVVLDNIRQVFNTFAFPSANGDFHVSLSAGVSAPIGYDMERTLAAADEALYAAKRSGRNQVQVYT